MSSAVWKTASIQPEALPDRVEGGGQPGQVIVVPGLTAVVYQPCWKRSSRFAALKTV